MKPRIFIDGEHGTTGLQIRTRLADRRDLELLSIPEAERRNDKMREDMLNSADIAILCLPDDASKEAVAMTAANNNVRIIDTSTAFRVHPDWAYGFAEMDTAQGDKIRAARYVANPGCYPTSAQLPLMPLLDAGQIDADDILIDAKSGVSGAGRALKEGSLYCEAAEGTHAYGFGSHRHGPDIEQFLSDAAGRPIVVNFTPHLMPMNRGMLSSIYVKMKPGVSADDLRATLLKRYADEPFVQVVPQGVSPQTRHVRGTNACHIGVFADRVKGRAMLFSVIDNLMKGASGQAVQNFNVMYGLPETMGLEQIALFP